MRQSAVVALVLLLAAVATARQDTVTVRFHHAHYQVPDPAVAMAEALTAVEGVRIIAQGLGVGIRSGREWLLFDRSNPGAQPVPDAPIAEAFRRAVDRLGAWGIRTEPQRIEQVGVARAFPDRPVLHVAFTTDDFDGIVNRIVGAGGVVQGRSDDAVLFDAGHGSTIEIVRDPDREERFWCPMHPDVRSADEGKCPLCAMSLVPIPPPKIGEYRLDVGLDREPESALVRRIRLAVREPDTNARVDAFAIVHEEPFHLFLISRDLARFEHLHPTREPDGTFLVDLPLPAGEYMLIADFLPTGGTPQMVQRAIVSGRLGTTVPAAPKTAALPRTVTVDGLSITLVAQPVIVGKEVALQFAIVDATSGQPVTDLQPYLGAPAHLLIARADLSDAIHAHPEEIGTGGPTISFHPLIPSNGEYRLWLQVRRGGRVTTAPFALRTEK